MKFELTQAGAFAPDALLRGCFFSSVRFNETAAKRPSYRDPKQLAGTSEFELWQVGYQLDQADADVCLGLIKLSAQTGLIGNKAPLLFKAREFLAGIGKATGKTDRDLLDTSIKRITRATFIVKYPPSTKRPKGRDIEFHLLDTAASEDTDGDDKRYALYLSPTFVKLFAEGWTLINLTERAALRGDMLAQWLHNFYSSHGAPKPHGQATLQALAGRSGMQDSKWVIALTNALARVKAVTAWHTCDIDPTTGVVTVGKLKGVKAVQPQKKLGQLGGLDLTGKRERLKLAAAVAKHQLSMTPEQIARSSAIATAAQQLAERASGSSRLTAEAILTIHRLGLEATLHALAKPPRFPALRKYVEEAHLALAAA